MLNNGQPPVQRCLCDGRYEGCVHGSRCEQPAAGGQTARYFCIDCNPRRMEHLDRSLATIGRRIAGASFERTYLREETAG
jgi:hypothetical protein